MDTKRITWAARGLATGFALFLSIFALDVFQEPRPIVEILLGVLLHLAPAGLVLAALAVAWRREPIGGSLFLALAISFIVMAADKPISWSLIVAGPTLLIGLLFLLSVWLRKNPFKSVSAA